MILVAEKLYAKVAQQLFEQVRGNYDKNPLHPQNFACSYTYGYKCARMRFHCANGLVVYHAVLHVRGRGESS